MKEKRDLLTGIGLIGAFALLTVLIRRGDIYADATAVCRNYLSDHSGREGVADRKGKDDLRFIIYKENDRQ